MRKITAGPATTRRTWKLTARRGVFLILVTAITGTLVYQTTSSLATRVGEAPHDERGATTTEPNGAATAADDRLPDRPARPSGGPAKAEGRLPDGVSVFDDGYPGVAKLDPDLLQALRDAATEADDDGIEFYITSGWRSPKRQKKLLHEAVAEYGSEQEAARWVATAETSPHVSGDAADIGLWEAMEWLSEHGAKYGLCQIYGNEPWHYELRPEAIDHGCPAMYADPTHDPRMQ
jgi:hypothetical protein